MHKRILLLTKTDAPSREAQRVARAFFPAIAIAEGQVGDPPPAALVAGVGEEKPDWIISFLSPWIVPSSVLDDVELALNFHPGSCDYPGIGCYNFALYEGAAEYGAVCHHMLPAVDTGPVVLERCFIVAADETVASLRERTLSTMLGMLREILGLLSTGGELPRSGRTWTRRAFRRRELEALRHVTADMAPEEIRRRERAVTYPGFPGITYEPCQSNLPKR